MENESITVAFTYNSQDTRPFFYKFGKPRVVAEAVYVFVLLFIVYMAAAHYMVGPVPDSFRIGAVAFLILAPFSLVGLNLIVFERLAKRLAVTRERSVTVELTEAGITATEKHRLARVEWEAYKTAFEYKDRFVIYTDSGGLTIPKSCFSSEENLQLFKKLVERSLKGEIVQK